MMTADSRPHSHGSGSSRNAIALAILALVGPACREIAADGFPVSPEQTCPKGFSPADGRCHRVPPSGARLDSGPRTVDLLDASAARDSSAAGSKHDGQVQSAADAGGQATADAPVDGTSGGAPIDPGDGCDSGGCLVAIKIAARGESTCAILPEGSVACWGRNGGGQLGTDPIVQAWASRPVIVPRLSGARAIETGCGHTCAIVAGGAVFCWGANSSGELGDGSRAASALPVPVTGITGATAVAAGCGETCALVAGGSVKCWGGATFDMEPAAPTEVPGIRGATAISASPAGTCALVSEGEVECWGKNYGQVLPDGTRTSVRVNGLRYATVISHGGLIGCAILSDGTVHCWGDGVVADGSTSWDTAVQVPGLTAMALATGQAHACSLRLGAVRCWGFNTSGQLGDGTLERSTRPGAPVAGANDARAVAAGLLHTCAIVYGGHVRCWGANDWGQLGIGTHGSTTSSPTPVTVRSM
jgi:hypothetical protein